MNDYIKKKAMVETALIASITTIFAIGSVYIPILSLLIFLLPVPLLILAVRHGVRYTFSALIIISFLVGFLVEILYTILILLIFGPITLIMGYLIKRNYEPFTVIGLGTAALVLSMFAMFQLISISAGINIVDEIAMTIEQVLSYQMELIQNMNFPEIDLKEMIDYMMMLFPGGIIVISLIQSFINYYLTTAVLTRLRVNHYPFPEFSEFQLPNNIALGFFIIFILTLLTKYIPGIHYNALIANVQYISVFVLFLQGISVIRFLFKKANVNKFLYGILFLLILFFFPLILLVSIIGLADVLFNIRRIR